MDRDGTFFLHGINRFSSYKILTIGAYQCPFQVVKSDKMTFEVCHKGTKGEGKSDQKTVAVGRI
ncbi:hypothetical protein AO498_01285 [Algoriphagus sanaruensis]|uniref:Uncharacterized protein n=1 Tax=Algoriphagus sanaruensis TaxID=1727163 RepID=A0A142EIQ0_9BACT|nr:hypothetical protein AO498_01285 [Algoriphagus sanaruensis]